MPKTNFLSNSFFAVLLASTAQAYGSDAPTATEKYPQSDSEQKHCIDNKPDIKTANFCNHFRGFKLSYKMAADQCERKSTPDDKQVCHDKNEQKYTDKVDSLVERAKHTLNPN
jgi:hypothetical protein